MRILTIFYCDTYLLVVSGGLGIQPLALESRLPLALRIMWVTSAAGEGAAGIDGFGDLAEFPKGLGVACSIFVWCSRTLLWSFWWLLVAPRYDARPSTIYRENVQF